MSYCEPSSLLTAGVVARRPEYFPYLKERLTEEVVANWFGHLLEPTENEKPVDLVQRWDVEE